MAFVRVYDEICSVDGCDKQHRSKGYCAGHLYRFQQGLLVEGSGRECRQENCHNLPVSGGFGACAEHKLTVFCSVDGCTDDAWSKTFCRFHYQRSVSGIPLDAPKMRSSRLKYDHCIADGCEKPVHAHGYCSRHRTIITKYGIDALSLAKRIDQGDLCENGCGRPATDIDHCHNSNDVRGILCSSCNKGLGHFFDSPELLENAANYLRRFSD